MLVVVLYDFNAQPDSSEISIKTGEMLTVTRRDVGEGWWEGRNSSGQVGLFPAGYVSEATEAEPPASDFSTSPAEPTVDPNQGGIYSQGLYAPQTHASVSSAQDYDEDWDDDWDDDDDVTSQAGSTYQNSGPPPNFSGGPSGNLLSPYPITHTSSISTLNQASSGANNKGAITPVRRSVNRFSSFVKSGGEDYILGTKNKQAPTDYLITIVQDANGKVMWAPVEHPYVCTISSFKKESKLKGLKTYIAYQLTPTFNSIQVSRRYKQFDWLHGRFEEKFMAIPLPSLPDKQISGRYQDSFIEHRMRQLRLWINRVCRHPVLSQCDVWMHFLTCTDEKRWKNGKRRAENDEFKNASFFFTIKAPNVPLDTNFVEKKTEHFNK
jgi:sorting nexin-9/18/33